MRNVINYYYNFNIEQIHYADGIYHFTYLGKNYIFMISTRPLEELPALYELNQWLLSQNSYYHQIILNKDNQVGTIIDGRSFVLLKISNVTYDRISVYDIKKESILPSLSNNKILKRSDWAILWESKVDYLEYQLEHFKAKYGELIKDAYYFIGMAENAISYIKMAFLEASKDQMATKIVVARKRVNSRDGLNEFYNPMNLIYDYYVRDIAEYLKSTFVNDEYDLEIISEYLENIELTSLERKLLFGRLLFPSFFFDFYERIINEEDEIVSYPQMSRMEEYRIFIANIYMFLKRKGQIPEVGWITKKNVY